MSGLPDPSSAVHRSYGSVFKALHKETGKVVAIKQVPVDSDLQVRETVSLWATIEPIFDTTKQFSRHDLFLHCRSLWLSVCLSVCLFI